MLKKMAALILSLAMMSSSFASVETVKAKLMQQYPNVKINDLKTTEMQGLYSGTLDNQIVYVDEDVQHIFVGSMIRLKDQRNLTKDLAIQKNSIDFSKLPFNDAIKTVRGNGKRQLAIFSDPNCPYCKTLEGNLTQLNDVTIYTFIYPIKTQSILPSKQVWCSANKEFAWKNLIQNGVKPSAAVTCETPIERNLELGKHLGLQGTPAIIFSTGYTVMGAYPADKIEQIWTKQGL
ncbi:DsbC family protein [Acinetobacter silvestris]|uniref:Thiol:disulfide interchange protein n=1 Tax=Acinetobacter silvestris TaxID=1977882 RepID=A0A1Y3CAG3_9GAMM|nr:DsbC family protein [Acinetobacter silvestris]OTG62654.1 thiol:disulfide interchange protein [Acinetobacter silvestris]